MPLVSALIAVAGLGVAQTHPPTTLAEAAIADVLSTPQVPTIPHVAFEIHDVTTTSPDWRGRMLPKLRPIERQESVAAWALDTPAVRELLASCETDLKAKVFQAPRMVARLGDPVRMTNEDKSQYVAHMNRMSDGPPNEGTKVAFQPVVDEVHDGIRVELTGTRLKGPALLAHVSVQQNKVLGFITTNYTESVATPKPESETDPGVVRASFLNKLRPDASDKVTITPTIQVPEVASRRIDGDWLIPSDGAILVSLGPHSIGSKVGRKHYEERLILLTARVEQPPAAAPKPASTLSTTATSPDLTTP